MRKLVSDFTIITNVTPTVVDHPAWPAFLVAMDGREYGHDALWDAWLWFANGWDMKVNQLQAQATNYWCDYW
jgi:hypothetical protein